MSTQFTTPVGRLVWGHPLRPSVKTNRKTKQPVLDNNGKPVEQWVFGVAFPKHDFLTHIMPYLNQEAATLFPQGVPANFSWKIKDGDGTDQNGKPYNAREGYAGCYVLTVSTQSFCPSVYKHENGSYRQLTQTEIKPGDYIAVAINAKANKPTEVTDTPGLFINPQGIELIGYGKEIVSAGANPEELFASVNRTLPPGASAVPISSAPAGAQPPAAAPGGYPAPGQQYGQQPPAQHYPAPTQPAPLPPATHHAAPLPQPAYDFVNQAPPAQVWGGQQPAAGHYPAPNAAPNAGYPPTGPALPPTSTGYPAPGAYPSNGMPLPGQR